MPPTAAPRKNEKPIFRIVIIQLLERAPSDEQFRAQLKTNFDAAIKGYDLTADEIGALKKGDDATLRAMGVNERLRKWGSWR